MGQFSSSRPMGEKAGAMPRPTSLSTEVSLSSLPKLPSVPRALRKLSTSTMGTMILPARNMKLLVLSQVL